MRIVRENLQLTSVGTRPTFHKITKDVQEIVDRNNIQNGICVVYSSHTTCSVITQEWSRDETYTGLEYLQQDFLDVLAKIIPDCKKEGQYMHPGPLLTEFSNSIGEDKPQTLNTDAHLRAALIGRSVTLGIVDGKIDTGRFGHIYFIDFDQTGIRERVATIQIIGE